MTQNTSHAVMQQRAKPRNDGLDDFPTPPWAVRAFLHHVIAPEMERQGWASIADLSAWEPACNRGFMARPMQEYFQRVYCSDVKDYGWSGQQATRDFLIPQIDDVSRFDWIITNPPFRLAAQFAERCDLVSPAFGYALLTRIAFLEGVDRYNTIFKDNPPDIVAQYAERVPMVEGRHDPEASTATAYCWLVWLRKQWGPTKLVWIPPCRREFQRDDDSVVRS